jgi:hypothetical protein
MIDKGAIAKRLGFDWDGVKCPFCGKVPKPEEFRDELSVKEWRISNLCQACQDETFIAQEDEYDSDDSF